MNHWNSNTESLHYFEVGSRVQAHPATDVWMAGDRYGNVERIGRRYIHVRMDSRRLRKFTFDNVLAVR